MAANVARRILTDVVERGWPVGEVLGSQSELMERYGVSRAVFREAVRLVENQQVAFMRRGPGGGLVVTEPTVDAIIDAAVLSLHRANTRLHEVFEARIVLEVIAAELATERLTAEDAAGLRALGDEEVRDHRALHARLAALTRNPALELFVDILNRVAFLYFRGDGSSLTESTLSASREAHARIIEAVLDHDAAGARRRMHRHLEAESAFLQNRKLSRQFLPRSVALGGGVSNKRAEDVARAILQDVVADDLPPGTLIGSQTALIERYGASRAVFREALRLLEHHQIATMRRGPGGGLFVSAPNVRGVSDVVAVYLARRDISMADLVGPADPGRAGPGRAGHRPGQRRRPTAELQDALEARAGAERGRVRRRRARPARRHRRPGRQPGARTGVTRPDPPDATAPGRGGLRPGSGGRRP